MSSEGVDSDKFRKALENKIAEVLEQKILEKNKKTKKIFRCPFNSDLGCERGMTYNLSVEHDGVLMSYTGMCCAAWDEMTCQCVRMNFHAGGQFWMDNSVQHENPIPENYR